MNERHGATVGEALIAIGIGALIALFLEMILLNCGGV